MQKSGVLKQFPDGLVVRKALPADKAGALAIARPLFDGLDYLPYRYDYFMSHPQYHAFVAELAGDIIAFHYLFFPTETIVYSGGSRIKPRFEHQHYYSRFVTTILLWLKEKFKRLECIRYAAGWNSFQSKDFPQKMDFGMFHDFLFRNNGQYETSMVEMSKLMRSTGFQELLQLHQVDDIELVAKGEIPDMLFESTNNKLLFPAKLFMVVLEPLNSDVKANFEFAQETSRILITYSRTDRSKIDAVCLITEIPCDAGLRYDYEIYINCSLSTNEQLNLAEKNVLKGLLYLKEEHDNDGTTVLHINVNYPLGVPNILLHGELNCKLGWQYGPWSTGEHRRGGIYFCADAAFKYYLENAKL